MIGLDRKRSSLNIRRSYDLRINGYKWMHSEGVPQQLGDPIRVDVI